MNDQDQLKKLLHVDIPKDQERLSSLSDISAAKLTAEMQGTVLEYVREVAKHLIDIRNWSFRSMKALGDHLESTDERLGFLEDLATNSVLLPDDAEVLAKVSVGCRFVTEQLLDGPFPITERDDEGKQKLKELIDLCKKADEIISNNALEMEPESDEET